MNNLSTEIVEIRGYEESDRAFILATWLRGLRFGNDWFRLIDSKVYFTSYHNILESLLNKDDTTIKIACLKDDREVILGYSVYSDDRLHWMHVKAAWRKIGIAKLLTPSNVRLVTHFTKVGTSILQKHTNIIFNPFAL